MPYRNGRQGMVSGLQPTSGKSYISLHPSLELKRPPPLWGLETHSCRWRSPRSSLDCGGTRTSHFRSTSVCWRHSARTLSTSSEWSLTWNGEGTEKHSWCCTVPLFVPSLTGCIVYGIAWNTNLPQLDSIHNSGLRLALGAFCTSPVSSLYTEANEAPLEERRLKLSMRYYVKTLACIDNPAHHALHEFDWTTKDLYAPRPNGRGGMTRPPAPPIGLKVEEAMTSAEINAGLLTRITWWSLHWWLQNERESGGSGGHQLPFPEWWDNLPPTVQKTARQQHHLCSRGFSHKSGTELLPTRGPSPSWCDSLLWLNVLFANNWGWRHREPFYLPYHEPALVTEDTRVRFCWVPSHCGIDGNERVDQLAKEILDQDIDPLASVHYTDIKPLVNSTKWDVAVHGRYLYLVKPTLGPPKKFQHLTRAEEVVITRLQIGHTKATLSHILSRGPPTGCHHCGQTLTIDHMLLECALLQERRDEYYTVDSLNALFKTISETCVVEFLREAGFFYLIWCNLLTSNSL